MLVRDGSRYQIGWIFGRGPKGERVGSFSIQKRYCWFSAIIIIIVLEVFRKKMYNITFQNEGEFFRPWEWFKWTFWVLGGAQWAKSGGEAVLLQFSDSTKDPMHDFNRLFCWNSCDCEFWSYIMYLLVYTHEKAHASDDKSLKMNHATLIMKQNAAARRYCNAEYLM